MKKVDHDFSYWVNTAPFADLSKIVPTVRAKLIIDARKHGFRRTIDDLIAVRGIGGMTVECILRKSVDQQARREEFAAGGSR